MVKHPVGLGLSSLNPDDDSYDRISSKQPLQLKRCIRKAASRGSPLLEKSDGRVLRSGHSVEEMFTAFEAFVEVVDERVE